MFGGAIIFTESPFEGNDSLSITSSVLTNNTADIGGAISAAGSGTLNITDTTISQNSATSTAATRGGGGLSVQSMATNLTNVIIDDNTAAGTGGGIYNFTFAGAAGAGESTLTVNGGSITGNSAASGGGIFNENQNVGELATAILTGVTVSGNTASAAGGGIWSNSALNISGATITSNTATGRGGGVQHENTTQKADIRNSSISGNSGSFGGGVAVLDSAADFVGVLFSNNVATTGATNKFGTQLESRGSVVTLSNVTVNDEVSAAQGTSSIENVADPGTAAELYITNSTFVGSTGRVGIKTFAFAGGNSFAAYGHSIFSSYGTSLISNGAGTVASSSSGFNVFEDTPLAALTIASDVVGTNPQIGPLQDNGGPTFTRGLLANSPAIDTGDNTQALDLSDLNGGTVLTTDQRGSGFDRIADGDGNGTATADIGAFELTAAAAGFVVTAPVGMTSSVRPTVTWTAVSGALSYNLYVNIDDGGGNVFQQLNISSGQTSFAIPQDLEFARYRVFIEANMPGGVIQNQDQGHTFVVEVKAQLTAVGATLATSPTFTWNRVPGAASDVIFINQPGSPVTATVADPGSGSTVTHTIIAALARNDYKWWVRPVRQVQATTFLGPWSDANEFSTGGRTKITAPVRNSTSNITIPSFVWDTVPGAQSYEIYVAKTGTPGAVYRDAGIDKADIRARTLENGDHKVWIRTTLADGSSVWGSGVDFTVNAPATNLATAVTGGAGPGFDTTPTINWSATAGATSYDVYVHRGTQSLLRNVTGTSWTSDTALAADVSSVQVRPVNAAGVGQWSAPLGFSTSGQTTLTSPGTTTSDRTPTFNWIPVTGAIRYTLQVDNLTTGVTRVIREDGLTGTSFTPTSNLALGLYRAWVRAVSSTGALAPFSVPVDFTVTATSGQASDADETASDRLLVSLSSVEASTDDHAAAEAGPAAAVVVLATASDNSPATQRSIASGATVDSDSDSDSEEIDTQFAKISHWLGAV